MYRYITYLAVTGVCWFALLAGSCGTNPRIRETPLPKQPPNTETPAAIRSSEGGIVEEIRSSAEIGTPSSLQNGLDLIRNRGLGSNDFGRVMQTVITTLLYKVYPNPALRISVSALDLSQNHLYSRILKEGAQGNYRSPQPNSQDYLEHILPFLVLMDEANTDQLLKSLPDLKRAEELNPHSVLAPYFIGLVYERTEPENQFTQAIEAYQRAYTVSPECYPAALGLVRLMNAAGQKQEVIWLLQDLVIEFPDNMTIKRQLAMAYYHNNDWSRAEPAIREVLQRNSQDAEFILMQAHSLVEQGQYLKAVAPLDLYATMDTSNSLFLFLRARVQAEGYHNREGALNYLRSMLRLPKLDDEIAVYAAGLLLESNRIEEQQEGQELLQRLLQVPSPGLAVIELAFKEAVRRESWRDAKSYLPRLLNEGLPSQYLLSAYLVERGLGNKDAAFGYAKEFHEKEPSNDDGTVTYISALIDREQYSEAGTLIESRLAALGGGAVKAKYYYQRSRIQRDEEAVLNDLRSCLFEDPRNINALIGLLEIYHQRGDDRRAVYYYKQALSFDPHNPRLKQYEKLYGGE